MHTKKIKQTNKITKKLKKYLGQIIQVFKRKKLFFDTSLKKLVKIAKRIYYQKKHFKNKIYSIHAPKVECISKYKIHKKYEFGNKICVVTTSFGC